MIVSDSNYSNTYSTDCSPFLQEALSLIEGARNEEEIKATTSKIAADLKRRYQTEPDYIFRFVEETLITSAKSGTKEPLLISLISVHEESFVLELLERQIAIPHETLLAAVDAGESKIAQTLVNRGVNIDEVDGFPIEKEVPINGRGFFICPRGFVWETPIGMASRKGNFDLVLRQFEILGLHIS